MRVRLHNKLANRVRKWGSQRLDYCKYIGTCVRQVLRRMCNQLLGERLHYCNCISLGCRLCVVSHFRFWEDATPMMHGVLRSMVIATSVLHVALKTTLAS